MPINRRNWIKTASLITTGLCLPKLESFASPRPGISDPETGKGPVRLSSNENPYGPSPVAKAAMTEHIAGSNRYPWQMISLLMSAVAMQNNLAKENVLVGAGSTEMLDSIVRLAAREKGSFIMAKPTFSRWADAAEKQGLQKIEVPLTSDKRHDLNAMLQAIRPDTRLIYLCNPNNPTGTVCDPEAIRSFLKEATRKTLVMVDEAYLEYSGQPSVAGLTIGNESLIIVKTFSKIYGLAGARIGYALGHAKTMETLSELQSGADMGISAVSLAGAAASLNDTDLVGSTRKLNAEARKFTTDSMERLSIPFIPSHTNFIYFSLANYSKDFFELLKAHNIQGTGIFEQTGNWSRITVGTMTEMRKFTEAIS